MIFISTKTLNLYLLFIFLTINLLNLFLKNIIKFFAYYWEIFGIYLGKFMSPILLCFIYIISILSVNLLFRLLRVDTLNKEIVPKKLHIGQKVKVRLILRISFKC